MLFDTVNIIIRIQMTVLDVSVNDDRKIVHKDGNVRGLQIIHQGIMRIVERLIVVAAKVLDLLTGDTLSLHKVGHLVQGGVVHVVELVQDVQLGRVRHLPHLPHAVIRSVPSDAHGLASVTHQPTLCWEKDSTSIAFMIGFFCVSKFMNF